MIEQPSSKPVTLLWALACMAVSLAVAVAANETVFSGKGKLVFLGIFVTSFVAKSVYGMTRRNILVVFISIVALIHITMIAIGPNDSLYPGGLLFPIGVVDIGIFYLAFRWVQKRWI